MSTDDEAHLDLLRVRCTVRCGDPELAAVLRHLWSPFLAPVPSPGPVVAVTRTEAGWQSSGPGGRTTAASAHATLTALATELNHLALARTPLFAAHAAVVTTAGGTVALVGPSGVGKSTLTGALIRRGGGYVSDEALCLDRRTGHLVGYPRPLALSPWSRAALGVRPRWDPSEETLLAAADLGGPVSGATASMSDVVRPYISDIVLLEPPGEGSPHLAPATRQESAAALLLRSFNHWRDPGGSFGLAHALAAGARAWRLRPAAPGDTADHLLAELSGGAAAVPATASKNARRAVTPPEGKATERGSASS